MSVVARRTLLRSNLAVGVVWEVVLLHGIQKKHTTTRISTSVNQNTLVSCVRKVLVCASHHTPDYVNNVLVYFATVPVSTITNKTRYAHNRVKSMVTGFPDRSPITSANHSSVSTVSKR